MPSSRSQVFLSEAGETLFPSPSTRNMSFKTPARSQKRGRAVHNENTIYGHPRTAGPMGRKRNNIMINTPAMSGPLQHPLKTDKVFRTMGKQTALSEITNRTPFHNAQYPVTPGPASIKPSNSLTIFKDASKAPSARRISSTRKKLRLPRSASKSFQTPDPMGNHWDVSDGSIEASVIDEVSITEEDYDDVEYGPPTAIDPKYDPPLDLPNYKEVGASLMSLFRQTTIPEEYDPVIEFDSTALLAEIGPLEWERMELPEILSENVFPCMVLPDKTQTSTTNMQPTAVRPVPARVTSSLAPEVRVRSAVPLAPSSHKSTTPAKFLSKHVNAKATAPSHTRIPSLSKSAIVQAPASITQPRRPTMAHSRTASMPHSKTPGVTQSRTTGVSKLGPIRTRPFRADSQQLKVLDDTVQSLLAGPENEDEDVFFEV